MPKQSEFGKARRAFLRQAKLAGHEMGNNMTPWARQPWDKDESDVYRAQCANCDYEVQTYEEKGEIKTWHFSRIDAGTQLDIDSMPVKCSGKD
jgi:hypothetical protein